VVEIDKVRGEIIVQTSSQDAQVIKRAVDARFKKELMAKIDSLLPECQRITGKTINSYDIRKMTTSWGICHIKDRTVTFSLQLAQKSDEEIKYIIIHELTHLIEPNHSLKFKEHMTRFIPDWKRIKKEINS
jgi:predicted metal-dependent hydrolase